MTSDAFALGVTEELFEWVSAHKGHPNPRFNPKCFYSCFLKVTDLLPHMGNELNSSFITKDDLIELDDRVPFITLDCVSGELKMEDGNHRLASFAKLGYTWFPVIVAIICTPGASPLRAIPDCYQGCNDYDHARLWRGNEREILYNVFHLQERTTRSNPI